MYYIKHLSTKYKKFMIKLIEIGIIIILNQYTQNMVMILIILFRNKFIFIKLICGGVNIFGDNDL